MAKQTSITRDNLVQHQDALKEKFSQQRIAIGNVTQSYFSIARHYGACKIEGREFIYFPEDDILVRDDVVKFIKDLEEVTP